MIWQVKGSAMEEFLGEQIEVEQAAQSPRPVRFKWRGRTHDVVQVLDEYVDAGFGSLPPASRKWYTRRHRRYYVVKDSQDTFFKIYLDYSNRRKRSWWLVEKWTDKNPPSP